MRLFKYIVVLFLTLLSRLVLLKYHPFIVAVTGSVGKTTTKDAVFHVLKNKIPSQKSQKSFNSEIGVPLTILGLPNAWHSPIGWIKNFFAGIRLLVTNALYPKLLVLEVGADHPGDIRRIGRWLKPDIVVVTRIPDIPVHVENFPSVESVQKEKAELVKALKENGVFIANGDDPKVRELASRTKARMMTYGLNEGVDIQGRDVKVEYRLKDGNSIPSGMEFKITIREHEHVVRLRGVLGVQPVMSALAGIAVGIAKEVQIERIVESFSTLSFPQGRMAILSGKNGSVLIDDSYNSSPVALHSALETLKSIEAKHRIAVLGDMLELGEYSNEAHWNAGRLVGSFVDELVTVGQRATQIAEAAKTAGLPHGKIHTFSSSQEAGKWLSERLKTGDVVLIKGSQGSGQNMIRMERAIKFMLAHPEDAPLLLVRQEQQWQQEYTKLRETRV